MDKRTFYRAGIILGTITVLLSFFALPIESIVMGIMGVILNLKKRKEYRTLIGTILSVLGLLSSVGFLLFMMHLTTTGEFDYWFFRLLS